MSEDLQTRTTDPEQSDLPTKPKLELSFSKVLGGALAAMTAAGVGSRLSAAGTLIGAALASIVAAVAGAIYTASLKRTQEKVRTVLTDRISGPTATASNAPTEQPTTSKGWAVSEPQGSTHSVAAWSSPSLPTTAPRKGLNWKSVVVAALAIFAIAAAALTGFEVISGHALSGGQGTTITQVGEAKAARSTPPRKATASPTSAATAATAATAKPSETASSEPSSAPSASSAPVPTKATPTSAASLTPSAGASQQAPGPSGAATP